MVLFQMARKLIAALLTAIYILSQGPAFSAEASPAQGRFPLLKRGINVSWLGFYKGTGKFTFDRGEARRELKMIKAVGCSHVRLVLNIDDLRGDGPREEPAAKNLPELDAAIALCLEEGLAVVVDPFHYGKEGLLIFPGPQDPEAEVMVKFWGTLAKHLSKTDPERVFLEVANEPALDNPLDWYAVEARILKAMREGAPRHTLIAGYNLKSGKDEWDSVKALTLIPVGEDKNVIYNFHYYEPMDLTHQGAGWAWKFGALKGVPYPSSPEAVKPLLAGITDNELQWSLRNYGEKRWNKQRIESAMGQAAEWAKKNGALVTCNEFGVYRQVAPPEARKAWTKDVRESLEKFGMGWTVWEGDFGFYRREGGRIVADEPILEALGLNTGVSLP